ncbi:MAG: condensation domain-containing protein, partial [Ferruginibacter sp.]
MKNKQFNKTLTGTTGKDILGLMRMKENRSPAQNTQAPAGDTEITLFNFWKSLLGHDNYGVNDDFFQVGGNSLKAIQLLSRIAALFPVHLSLTDIFLQPTIAQIAKRIDGNQNGKASIPIVIEVKERPQNIPLSFNQERIWFIDRLEGSVQYHIPAVLRLNGKLNKDALAYAFTQIVNRHEVLRTVILENAGIGYQFIHDQNNFALNFIDLPEYKNDDVGLHLFIQQLINRPFDLSKEHMLRADLILVGEQEFVLVVTLHHIASDGWSVSIIIKELMDFYKAFEKGVNADTRTLPIQYADFAIWQRQYLQGEGLDRKLLYWTRKLEGITPLPLPTDYPRTIVQSFNGGFEEFIISKELTEQLHILSQQHGVTLFMTLLTVFKVLLYRYSGHRDISVGTAVAGRQQQELESLVGFFVNTLVLRSDIDAELSFAELLAQVKATTLEAFEHQEVPFGKVVEAVAKEKDMSRSPLFQVMFVLQNTPGKAVVQLGEVDLSEESFEKNKAKFELDFSLTETDEGLELSAEYCSDLFTANTIRQMIGHFKQLLESVVNNAQQKVGVLPMLSVTDEQQLLVDFNNTQRAFPDEDSVISLFEKQASKTPLATALVF